VRRRVLAGGVVLLLATSVSGCGDADDSHPAATAPGSTSSPVATPSATQPSTQPSTPSSAATHKPFFSTGQLVACNVVTGDLLRSDLGINPGRGGGKASSLGDAGEVLDCLYQGDTVGEANVVVRGTVHADRDLPANRYPLAAGAEAIPGADRGWVDLYGLDETPQARVLVVKGQVGLYIDISSDNRGLDVDALQGFAHDLLAALA
jgi:hypothetical protein